MSVPRKIVLRKQGERWCRTEMRITDISEKDIPLLREYH
jgi:hypothetical protein